MRPGSTDVRLEAPPSACRYALLSYCWGGDQSTKITKHNLASYERGIDIRRLPRMIRDAIEMTKTIGLENLWVNALCKSFSVEMPRLLTSVWAIGIVQDDEHELTQEIGKQVKMYQGGEFSILAGGAASMNEDFHPIVREKAVGTSFLSDFQTVHVRVYWLMQCSGREGRTR
jgi:hypothetical protein